MVSFTAYLEERGRDAVLAEPGNDVDDEKGRPAEQEDAHDDADRDGRLRDSGDLWGLGKIVV